LSVAAARKVAGPAIPDPAYTRRCAVEMAALSIEAGEDTQETQRRLVNDYPYSALFADLDDDAAEIETMAIIREAEAG
jgi:hypothetical protein